MTPVLTPGSSIRAAYDSAVAAGRGAQADYFVRRGYDRSALDADVLAALATWGHVEAGSLPHASHQGSGTGGCGDTCLCIRPSSGGRWSKSRASRLRPLTDEDREYIAALPAPIPVPGWTARELRILHGIAASFGGVVFADVGSAIPRPGKRDGNVIAGADYIVPRVRKDSEGVNYVVEPSLSAHGMSVHLAWSGRNAQWRVVTGARQYHVSRNVSARQALRLALAGWQKQRRASSAAAAARPELAHIYVSREHSLAAGNCQPITDSFARSAWSAIGAVGECAVRADVVLGLRDDAYTQRAIALASEAL